ncbi:unnamed protein product [Schistosoma mattheei]|uniref:Uncharacterized protein n=2 Tax=Schistosoma TaxID=6181 RepID=A0A183MRB9_9TREM|nr:unnamed protein product [Schistosoma mattheei]VDP28441.1 unnamed protein product [Schistosoma margrebowiei]
MAKAPNGTKDYDEMYKLLLVGDSSVGKTNLLLRFSDNSFSKTFIATIGNGIMLVYDVTNIDSYHNITTWMNNITEVSL